MALNKYKLGDLIEQRREKYNVEEDLQSWGISREGFISPKQDGADTSIYNSANGYLIIFRNKKRAA
jgi:type I restriction enzyme S subunit